MKQIARRGYAPGAVRQALSPGRSCAMKAHGDICRSRRSIEPRRHGLRALVTRPRAEAAEPRRGARRARHRGDCRAAARYSLPQRARPPISPGCRPFCAPAPTASAPGPAARRARLAAAARSAMRPRRGRGDEGFARVESAGGSVDDLVRLARERLRPEAGRLLHVAGSDVAGDLAGALRADGFAVDRARALRGAPGRRAERRDGAGAAPKGSSISRCSSRRAPRRSSPGSPSAPGSPRRWRRSPRSRSAPRPMRRSATLRFRERHVAERPDQPSLLAALDRLLAERRRA